MILRRLIVLAVALLTFSLSAQQLDPSLYKEMRWRHIGPFRGGRTVAAVGVPQQPNVFYIGVNNGGVWKTTDYGRIWSPIFDDQPTQSIGAIAIAPSDPNVIYVGSGEGLQRPDLSTGDGMYKSLDAGRTWTHLGLRDAQQISMIAVDPRDANRLLVAVLGHPYGPNEERGIYRSTDGGTHFERVLYKGVDAGAMDVALDPSDPQTVYAVLWAARNGPWENAYFTGKETGLYKSKDGGTTWTQLTNGLPGEAEGVGRIGIEVAPADPKRLYAVVAASKKAGVYRSLDAGATWELLSGDERLWGRDGDFQEIRTDPKNADIVYVANVVTWKSIDGGRTWRAFRGAPGGDDYHRLWINPNDPRIILNASDQGAIVTVNGGETWSSWYNQPTAQMYHVSADNAFPYRVCGGQQESGSACVESRSDSGRITFHDWQPVGAEEYGYAVPDPLDPDLVFGGKISRFDRRTNQSKDISPRVDRGGDYRVIRTQPIAFSPADPHTLFFASNTVWKTTNRGESWDQISPDLTRKTWALPPNVGTYTAQAKVTQRGVVYALAPSPLDVNLLWAGTDDGLIHVTPDGGKTWKDVTPPQLVPWAKVSILEASHFDRNEAWAAINTFRLDDLRPHILRTKDGGATWTETVSGIPAGGIVNVVREDPKTRGLLFAGSEQTVYVSFDDGEHWSSLRQNLPATSIRDLIVHGDDLAVATHGRGFWIFDDIEPLRQLAGKAPATAAQTKLYAPQQAIRWRWSNWPDTPLPPDEATGENPPEGAIIDYQLAAGNDGAVTLEIADANGRLVRRYSSDDKVDLPKDEGNVPAYWIRPQRALPATPGMHRVTWNLHYTPLPGKNSYPIGAVPGNTAPDPRAPWAAPGDYVVKLTAGGQTFTQPLRVIVDPRVKTSAEDLALQNRVSLQLYDGAQQASAALETLSGVRAALRKPGRKLGGKQEKWDKEAASLSGVSEGGDEEQPTSASPGDTLTSVIDSMTSLMNDLQNTDAAPTSQQLAAAEKRLRAFESVMKKWEALQKGR